MNTQVNEVLTDTYGDSADLSAGHFQCRVKIKKTRAKYFEQTCLVALAGCQGAVDFVC